MQNSPLVLLSIHAGPDSPHCNQWVRSLQEDAIELRKQIFLRGIWGIQDPDPEVLNTNTDPLDEALTMLQQLALDPLVAKRALSNIKTYRKTENPQPQVLQCPHPGCGMRFQSIQAYNQHFLHTHKKEWAKSRDHRVALWVEPCKLHESKHCNKCLYLCPGTNCKVSKRAAAGSRATLRKRRPGMIQTPVQIEGERFEGTIHALQNHWQTHCGKHHHEARNKIPPPEGIAPIQRPKKWPQHSIGEQIVIHISGLHRRCEGTEHVEINNTQHTISAKTTNTLSELEHKARYWFATKRLAPGSLQQNGVVLPPNILLSTLSHTYAQTRTTDWHKRYFRQTLETPSIETHTRHAFLSWHTEAWAINVNPDEQLFVADEDFDEPDIEFDFLDDWDDEDPFAEHT